MLHHILTLRNKNTVFCTKKYLASVIETESADVDKVLTYFVNQVNT